VALTMKRYASLIGWVGAVMIAFALVSALVETFSSGVIVLDAVLEQFAWSIGNFVLGVVLVVVALVANLDAVRQRLRSGEARRASKYGTSAIVGMVLVVALLAIGAYWATQHEQKWDFTAAQLHSLSEQTVQTLGALKEPLHITALYNSFEHRRVNEFLAKYRELAPERVTVEVFDPQKKPGRVRELGVANERLATGLIHVKLGAETTEVTEATEEALTNAIVKLTRRGAKKVYFSIGHNERAIEGEAAQEGAGMSGALEALKNEGFEVSPLLLASTADVPADAQVLVIAGPTRPFIEAEHALLQRYLERGGSLLVMMDPRAQTDLAPDLAKWGVKLGDDVVVDIQQALSGQPFTPFAAQYGDHPITRTLGDFTLFAAVSSVKPVSDGNGLEPIVTTGEQSWAESDFASLQAQDPRPDPEADIVGTVPIAVAGEAVVTPAQGKSRGRLVVFGDSDFATNQWIAQFRNRDLFLNAVNWLLGEPEGMTIRPRRPGASQLAVTTETLRTIRTAALFVVPEAIALLGVIAWWRRRRAPGR
jgi:ABC-type uncharacterized transport system involved in gliding motility auxiliary subunit